MGDRSHQQLGQGGGDGSHPGPEAVDGGSERQRLRVAHQPARRSLDQPSHQEEHLVLHRRGNGKVEGVDGSPRVGGVEHVARDDVAVGQGGERESGLVAQAREEADPGAVHDRVGDDRGHDLAAQRV